ncbi:MAG: hypothetical protein P4M13_07555 [Alphaproteobacteria bacterium]|nr:hypothetical protein [Alphaproteobacteria bacterium]
MNQNPFTAAIFQSVAELMVQAADTIILPIYNRDAQYWTLVG